MLAIISGMWIMFITIRSSLGLVADVRDWPYSTFHCYVRLGLYLNDWVLPWLEPKADMVNLTNNPRAHTASLLAW